MGLTQEQLSSLLTRRKGCCSLCLLLSLKSRRTDLKRCREPVLWVYGSASAPHSPGTATIGAHAGHGTGAVFTTPDMAAKYITLALQDPGTGYKVGDRLGLSFHR